MASDSSSNVVRHLDEAARARPAGEFFDAIAWDGDESAGDPRQVTAAEFLERLARRAPQSP